MTNGFTFSGQSIEKIFSTQKFAEGLFECSKNKYTFIASEFN
jgi:hypothetical protein